MSALYHHLIEPALVGGGVLFALGLSVRRFLPRRRSASAGASGCSSCSGCGGCGSTPPAETQTQPIVVMPRRLSHKDTGLPLSSE